LAVSLTIELQQDDELRALLAAQLAPGSSQYRRWLSPDEFAARFGASVDAYGALTDWLRNAGFSVHPWPSRTRIDLVGTVAQVEETFAVPMRAYRHLGRRVLANAAAPWIPVRFASLVRSLRLQTVPLADPVVRVRTANVTLTVVGPQDAATVYDFNVAYDRALDGTGQTIAVVARSDFDLADVAQFQDQFGAHTRMPQKVFPATNPGIGSPDFACADIRNPSERSECLFNEEAEVVLDVEWSGAMAPGATILVDISDRDIDFSLADIVNAHPEAKIISISFGACERLDPTLAQWMEPLYLQAAAQGQTVVVAAGNDGADACQDGGPASVNALASSPEVTAVGGTALDPGFDGNGDATGYVSETIWNDTGGASGGGVSALIATPAYQSDFAALTNGFRGQPDVALMASPTRAGYVTVIRGNEEVVGGTSVATPVWAATVALINQAAGTAGSGILNVPLYALAAAQYDDDGPAVFHDVTVGDNGLNGVPGFSAGPGFDLASGLGTPNVGALVRALATPACVADCDRDGVVTVHELVTAVNIALDVQPIAACSAADTDADGRVTVSDISRAVHRAIDGC
jgi:subtilase family serine protease